MNAHGIEGPVALPGEATVDGTVVPAHAGASPTTLAIVATGVAVLSVLLSALILLAILFELWWVGLGGGLLVGLVAVIGAGRALFRADGLRIGARDVALVRGNRVLWRRGLHEIERVELNPGGDYLQLVTVDGEARGASLGNLWDQPGAAEAVAVHLRGAVERARRSPEALAEPDAGLVAMVGGVRR